MASALSALCRRWLGSRLAIANATSAPGLSCAKRRRGRRFLSMADTISTFELS